MIVDDYPALIWKIKTNEKSAWYLYHIPFTKISKMWNLKKKKKNKNDCEIKHYDKN